MTDEELVLAIIKGDTHLFAEIVNRYKDRIYHITYRFTNGHSDCQDLSQDIFLLIYRNLSSFRGQSSLSTWIYRLAVNRCLDWCRKNKKRRLFSSRGNTRDDSEKSEWEQHAVDFSTPEDLLIQKERDYHLHQAISRLPDKYKAVIIMYHFQSLSYKEIGDILHLPVRTVETHLYRAKKKLKDILDKTEGGDPAWHVKEYSPS